MTSTTCKAFVHRYVLIVNQIAPSRRFQFTSCGRSREVTVVRAGDMPPSA